MTNAGGVKCFLKTINVSIAPYCTFENNTNETRVQEDITMTYTSLSPNVNIVTLKR